MKAKEVHNFNDEEVDIEIVRLKKRLFELRCQKVTDKIEDTSQFKKARRDIARLHDRAPLVETSSKATASSEATSREDQDGSNSRRPPRARPGVVESDKSVTRPARSSSTSSPSTRSTASTSGVGQ